MRACSANASPAYWIRTLTIGLMIAAVVVGPVYSSGASASGASVGTEVSAGSEDEAGFSLLMPTTQLADSYPFFGLAGFYNEVRFDLVTPEGLRSASAEGTPQVLGDEWLVASGRYKAHAIRTPGLAYRIDDAGVWVEGTGPASVAASVAVEKNQLASIAPELEQLRYVHLWNWLGALAKLVETTLSFIHAHVVASWGMAILCLAFITKLLLLPVSWLTAKLQRSVTAVQAQLLPELAEIKANFDGEEAHEKIMAAHSRLGVSPFYTLKPMLGTLIQVPVLIAVFNALGEMPALQGSRFLWVDDLAYPDTIAQLSFSVPLLGDKLSLLPLLMTAVTLLATLTLTRTQTSDLQLRAEKQRLMLMAAGFLLLFYPFPAAMVMYWTMTNLLQLPLQRLLKA